MRMLDVVEVASAGERQTRNESIVDITFTGGHLVFKILRV
jgi:hypothetical protein